MHRDLRRRRTSPFLALEPDGEVLPKLVDFGISKMRHTGAALTARGALVGTPCYMAPEQARGEEVDARCDVFGVGILLYECLSGNAPFGGDTLHEIVRSVLETEPPMLQDVPADLWRVVARAMAKRVEDRYASASDLAKAIVEAVPGVNATFRSIPPGPTSFTSVPPAVSRTTITLAERPPRSRRALAVAGACAVGLSAVWLAALRQPVERAGGAASAGDARGGAELSIDSNVVARTAAPVGEARAPATGAENVPAPPASIEAPTVPVQPPRTRARGRAFPATDNRAAPAAPGSTEAAAPEDAGAPLVPRKREITGPGALVKDPGF